MLTTLEGLGPDLLTQLEREVRQGLHKEEVRARVEAKRLGQIRKEAKAVNGVGEHVARIPAHAYHYWGQRLGYQCWDDAQFMREFLRDNPECKVHCGGTGKIMAGYTGNRRFSKSYG